MSASYSRSRAPKVLIACAPFKGTLSSLQAGRAIQRGLAAAGAPSDVVALADGGEGLVAALARVRPDARRCSVRCRGPLGETRRARFLLLPPNAGHPRRTAVIEMAASSGLPLLSERQRDPKRTTTLGFGDQIRAALERDARTLLLGLGGSATNDGGAGMAQALGARLLDRPGRDLPPGGAALLALERIEWPQRDPRLRGLPVTVACDVDNPLCGKRGASAVYAPQKGAAPADVALLDRALARFARIIKRDLGKDVRNLRGAGAAGGLGAGCVAFLDAELKPGIELVLDAIGFERRLQGAALVITGEGFLDRQTLMGKAPAGVAARARKARLPCVAVGGGIAAEALPALARRFDVLEDLSAFAGSARKARAHGAACLARLARERGRLWLETASAKRRR